MNKEGLLKRVNKEGLLERVNKEGLLKKVNKEGLGAAGPAERRGEDEAEGGRAARDAWAALGGEVHQHRRQCRPLPAPPSRAA